MISAYSVVIHHAHDGHPQVAPDAEGDAEPQARQDGDDVAPRKAKAAVAVHTHGSQPVSQKKPEMCTPVNLGEPDRLKVIRVGVSMAQWMDGGDGGRKMEEGAAGGSDMGWEGVVGIMWWKSSCSAELHLVYSSRCTSWPLRSSE
ncbi:hypothetical protein EYF80_006439 [Liparis tanakae]|uniref:Uncharacterized protein n=1 Tax=Liparis tanakae TaxID=230148 RepID=A0A4Z2J1A8_9TELE|nr:hypothetical protein EYF80_006439 [Liparis tanakae]